MASIVSEIISVLSDVIRQEYGFLGGLHGELQSIKDEFQQMMDFLQGADFLVQDHPELRSWVAQVRDVAYDVEDVLDEFVMQCTTYYHHSTRWYGLFRKMYIKSVGAIKARHELANQVQKIKKRIKEISESHERYKTQYQSLLPEQALSSRNMHDKRTDALLFDEADLVGIEVPKKELIDLILNDDGKRNVISVVGMGGLGKTTLVKKVYDDVGVKTKFVLHVWITVSESFKLEELFKDTIRQLFKEEDRQVPQELDVMDIDNLKSVVKDLLQTKKYIVVFDDVWQPTHWDAIHLAFSKNQLGSRIVITTRKHEVGLAASKGEAGGYVYTMRALHPTEAKQLFYRKAFSGDTSCPQHLKQTCENILGKCRGLPLAIEVIGSSLARRSQRTDEWESFYKRLGVEMDRNSSLDAMEKLLSLSYYDLPLHLKNCFLYLSLFPEDSKIFSSNLVELWIVEGLVETIEGMTLEETGESYLNELVDRSLVQVAEISSGGAIDYIRVHDIIRHMILLKAREHNITTIYNGAEGMNFRKNVKRLSVQGSLDGISEQAQDYCKSIRILYVFTHTGGYISEAFLSHLLLRGGKLLKLLHLNNARLKKFPDEILKLFHLRYLSLLNTQVRYIPKSIGMLQSLQFLNLRGTQVTILPLEFQKLQHLRHLLIGRVNQSPFIYRIEDTQGVRASFRIGCLKLLQELHFIEADNIEVVTEVGKLINLRRLGITKLKREDGKELCSSLPNLKQLRHLWVYSFNEEEDIDFQYLKPSDLPRLQILLLAGRLEKCPELLASLSGLTEIRLIYSKLRDDPLQSLHNLPNLVILSLTAAYTGESLCFNAGFPKLKMLFLFSLEELRWVTVEENAMPSLQELYMRGCQSMEEIPAGIQYLINLQDLEFANMSNEFANKLENLDKKSAAFKRLLQIPRVDNGTWTDGSWSEYRRLNRRTGNFNNIL